MASSNFTNGRIREKPSPSLFQSVCAWDLYCFFYNCFIFVFCFSLVWCWTFWIDLTHFPSSSVYLCFVCWGFLNFILQSLYWFVYDATIVLILRVSLIPWLFLFIASSVRFIDAVFFIALKILNIDFCFLLHCLRFLMGPFVPILSLYCWIKSSNI